MLHQNIFFTNWKYSFYIPDWFESFFFSPWSVSCYHQKTRNAVCQFQVGLTSTFLFLCTKFLWSDLNIFFFFFLIEFNIKVHFSVWCSGFGTAKWFTTSENYNMGKMLNTKNLDLKLKIQLSWKKWRISSFHPKILLEIGQHILHF